MNTQVLTVSSKGQISLPVAIRKLLSINSGDKLVAYASGDVIMLKTLKLPTAEEFKASLDEAQEWAADVGYQEEDVNDIIKSVRQRKRKEDSGMYDALRDFMAADFQQAENRGEIRGEIRGEERAKRETAIRLADMGLPLDKIADAVETSEKQVEEWLSESLVTAAPL